MLNKVHLIDNMEFMKDKPDNHYDLAIVDPPYNVGASDGNFGRSPKGSGYRKELHHYANHNKTPDKKYFEQLFRISENQIIWGSNYYPQYLFHSGAIIWHKKDTGPLSDCEIAFQSFSKLVNIFNYPWSGFRKGFNGNKNIDFKTIHPNQKPVDLYKWLLKNYAKPGMKIFDSHVGSGSIRIACHDMGFDLEGCEIDADYFNKQEDRFNRHIKQQDLFTGKDLQELIF